MREINNGQSICINIKTKNTVFVMLFLFAICLLFIPYIKSLKAYYSDCSQHGEFAYSNEMGQCCCGSGYIWSDESIPIQCVSESQYYKDKYCRIQHGYGYGAIYNSISGNCECRSGYILDDYILDNVFGDMRCVSEHSYCYVRLGLNSKYNSLLNNCECKDNFVLNENNNRCISCPAKYGLHSSYDHLSRDCECDEGYECVSVENIDDKIENNAIPEGALIRAKGDIDVYIVKYVGLKKFKRLILSPSVFNNYGHLRWEDVMDVDQIVLDEFATSELVRAVGDYKIYRLYPQGDNGQKRLIKNNSVLTKLKFDSDSIYEINSFDRESYITGTVLE